jgi:hypothetical protein
MARPRKKAPSIKNYAQDTQDTYTKRIEECQNVLDHLEKCPAWEVIIRDLTQQKQYIDDNWQNIPEGDNKLRELRVTKMAYNHLLNLKDGYQLDLENAKKELHKLQNTDKVLIKDYDNA